MSQNEYSRPKFATNIIEKYLSSQSNIFILYGNIKDIYPVSIGKYVSLTEFLVDALIKPNRPAAPRIVVEYDPAEGISFWNPQDMRLMAEEIGAERLDRIIAASKRDVLRGVALLREFSRINIMAPCNENMGNENKGEEIRKDFAFIVKHGEAVAPGSSGDVSLESERLKGITVENWFQDSEFVASSDIVFLTSETLSGVSDRIIGLPYVSAVSVERPSQLERKNYIDYLMDKEDPDLSSDTELIAASSAGLTLLSIGQIFRRAAFSKIPVTPSLLFEKTKEIIEKELEGYIEFPRIEHDFNDVIGATKLLKKLRELKKCLLSGDRDLAPVGILVPGANGVGKTYIYKALARECQWVAVVLKNIRGQYVGQTEKNWERIRSVLEAMSSVMVLYDEADTEIGGRGAQTHDVDRRLFGRILSMMSDPHNRGKIVWILITARPDRLAPDIKRAGRAGEHLPVFGHEGYERKEFLMLALERAGARKDVFSESQIDELLELTIDYYPSDFDQLLTELRRRRYMDGDLTPGSVLDEAQDFIPPDIARQREFQELLAVLECTSRELLPDKYANTPKSQIEQTMREIKMEMALKQ